MRDRAYTDGIMQCAGHLYNAVATLQPLQDTWATLQENLHLDILPKAQEVSFTHFIFDQSNLLINWPH